MREWAAGFLRARARTCAVRVHDGSRTHVSELIARSPSAPAFPAESSSWQVRCDIVGLLTRRKAGYVCLVEVKSGAISVRDLSQVLGYCRVVRPVKAFLLSPAGAGRHLWRLVREHARYDLLEYDWPPGRQPRSIVVARWNTAANQPDPETVLCAGALWDAVVL